MSRLLCKVSFKSLRINATEKTNAGLVAFAFPKNSASRFRNAVGKKGCTWAAGSARIFAPAEECPSTAEFGRGTRFGRGCSTGEGFISEHPVARLKNSPVYHSTPKCSRYCITRPAFYTLFQPERIIKYSLRIRESYYCEIRRLRLARARSPRAQILQFPNFARLS